MALAGLAALPVIAAEASEPTAGEILQGINMFTPEEGDPAYKVKANEQYGTQWAVDMAYGYWHSNNTSPDVHDNANLFLIHAQLNQRLIEDNMNGGTWLRVEFSGSWGLDSHSDKTSRMFSEGTGSATYPHADIYGGHEGVLPEVALMQYFNNKRSCVIAGMVNLTNYFDAVGIANDSFSSFTNDGFINSSVLGLPDANLGIVLQHEIDSASYAMFAASSEATGYGDNPFKFHGNDSFLLVGEYGRMLADGATTIRLNPFYRYIDNMDGTSSNNVGLAGSIEHEVCDSLSVYSRAGWAARQEAGNGFDFTCGANVKLIPSREDDFLGLAFGVFKGASPVDNDREYVAEAMYSLQLNDYFKLVPHIQYIANPAYDPDNSDVVIMGVQGVFSF